MFEKFMEMSATMMVISVLVVLLILAGLIWMARKMMGANEGMIDESDTMKYARLAELFEGGKDNINKGMQERNAEAFAHGLA